MLHLALLATYTISHNLAVEDQRIGYVSHIQTDIESLEARVLACEVLGVCSHKACSL